MICELSNEINRKMFMFKNLNHRSERQCNHDRHVSVYIIVIPFYCAYVHTHARHFTSVILVP